MKLTLAMIVRNEESMLEKTLPIVAMCFNEVVAVDHHSTDKTVDLLRYFGARVNVRKWTDDYAAARNAAIGMATGDAVMMFDADEAMFPEDIKRVAKELERSSVVALPRIEFVDDLDHYDPGVGPDWQCRFFRAGAKAEFHGKVHESLFTNGQYSLPQATKLADCPIYHYGQTKPVAVTVLRHHNYKRIHDGLPTIDVLPDDVPLHLNHNSVKFPRRHPLSSDNQVC